MLFMIPYAGILTHNRNLMATNLVDKMVADDITTFVLDHNSDSPFVYNQDGVFVWRETDFTGDDFNISVLWGDLLDQIQTHHYHNYGNIDYCVTVFNDDADPSKGFCKQMADFMEYKNVDVVSAGNVLHVDKTPPAPIGLDVRPNGWAWTVRGGSDVWPDERFRVWYGDDDLWQQAKAGRGYALTTSATCGNLDADGNFTRNPWWQEQAGRDREAFKNKYGFYSW